MLWKKSTNRFKRWRTFKLFNAWILTQYVHCSLTKVILKPYIIIFRTCVMGNNKYECQNKNRNRNKNRQTKQSVPMAVIYSRKILYSINCQITIRGWGERKKRRTWVWRKTKPLFFFFLDINYSVCSTTTSKLSFTPLSSSWVVVLESPSLTYITMALPNIVLFNVYILYSSSRGLFCVELRYRFYWYVQTYPSFLISCVCVTLQNKISLTHTFDILPFRSQLLDACFFQFEPKRPPFYLIYIDILFCLFFSFLLHLILREYYK